MKGWDPKAFDKARKAAGLTYQELSNRLMEQGWSSGMWTVRRWATTDSYGPAHGVQVVAIAGILECDYYDLIKEA